MIHFNQSSRNGGFKQAVNTFDHRKYPSVIQRKSGYPELPSSEKCDLAHAAVRLDLIECGAVD